MSSSHELLQTVDLTYGEVGSGSPLVLIHGLGGSGADWPLQLPFFAQHYRTIAVDLRGHGQSPKPPGPYRMSLFAADLALLLLRLAAHPAHLIGLSLGGAVAQQLAVDYPELVRSLVLVNTAPRFIAASWRQRALGLRRFANVYLRGMDRIAEDIAERLFPLLDQAPLRAEAISRLAANDLAAYRASLWAVARFDITFLLDLITCPALVVAGDRDTTLPMGPKQMLAEQLPHGRFLIIKDSAHATPIDQAQIFNQVVLEFLAEVNGKKAEVPA
jgi:pimeloyl-ACP methyl ester carboxylesterase